MTPKAWFSLLPGTVHAIPGTCQEPGALLRNLFSAPCVIALAALPTGEPSAIFCHSHSADEHSKAQRYLASKDPGLTTRADSACPAAPERLLPLPTPGFLGF